ncbi:MAG: InlB B-repeat-containing protein [Clostridia bacterium]|nr:InlB B-repeat-containing protein [Clostridia bacterium]
MKKALCLVLTLILCLSSVAAFADVEGSVQGDIMLTSTEGQAVSSEKANTITFSDIVADSQLGEAVYKLVEAKVIAGYPDGTFRPNAGLTRAELCKMINLVFDLNEKSENMSFTDVTKDDWYYDYVLVAVKAGYIKGFQDNTFRGDDPVTREQACAIINRVTKAKEIDLFDLPFTDNITDEVSDWALEDVKKIIANYIMPLEAGGKFRATENITRAELALALESFVVILPEYTVTFNSNGGSEVESLIVKEGKKATKPADPTKKDYKFKGWYTDSKLKTAYDFESIITADITLYAAWTATATGGGGGGVYIPPSTEDPEPATYTVTFKFNNGDADATQTVTQGSLLTKPADPTKQFYVFEDWYTDSGLTNAYDFTIPVTDKLTLYAGWGQTPELKNEQRIFDLGIFKTALETQLADGLFAQDESDAYERMVNNILSTFESAISAGQSGATIDEDYIRTNYQSNMLQIQDIWENELFVDTFVDEKREFKNNILVVLTVAQSNGYTMTVGQTYNLFQAVIGDFIDWE